MSLTVRDEATLAALSTAMGPEIEVFSPDGKLLGRFRPAPRPGVMFPEFGMTDEELAKRDNDPNATWHTPEEVSARLRSLNGKS